MNPDDLRADSARYWSTIEASAEIGVGREGGLQRLALTDADREMRERFVAWCREAGMGITIDKVGNIFAHRAGRDDTLAPVLVGSHLDTQANGGRFDGIAGVLAGLEVVRTLNDIGHVTKRPIEVVNWSNEEGARFTPPMLASGCFAGDYDLDWVYARKADDGCSFRDELERIGYLGDAEVGGRAIDSYFELHIEQGPELDATRTRVGVVTHGYCSHGMLVEFRGETAHTGPWPMEKRRNALIAGARLLVAVDDIGWAHADTGGKGTGAQLVAWPNKAGTLSDWAQVVCDVRHEDPKVAGNMRDAMRHAVDEAARRAQCDARIVDTWEWGGDIFDTAMVQLVRDTADRLGYTHCDLPSQAGHDAYFLARLCPAAMVFTPCRDGITHNNRELTTEAETAAGLNVLLHSVLGRADR
jgi:beta-ureidopropionase / N-carbamoyl-L-amino-acid hydrolase